MWEDADGGTRLEAGAIRGLATGELLVTVMAGWMYDRSTAHSGVWCEGGGQPFERERETGDSSSRSTTRNEADEGGGRRALEV